MTFEEFCGNSTFWDNNVFNQEHPKFPECFVSCIPALGPVAWIIVTLPSSCLGMCSPTQLPPLSLRSLSASRTGISIILALLSLFAIYSNYHYGYLCRDDVMAPTSFVLSASLLTASYLYVAMVTQINRRKGVISSWTLWFFWILVVICGAIPLQDNIMYQPSCISSITNYISYGLSWIQVVLYSVAERPSLYQYQRLGKPPCPKPYASVFSKLFFWWFMPIIKESYKRTITKDDLWDQHPEIQAEKVIKELQAVWTEEQKKWLRKRLPLKPRTIKGAYRKNGTVPGYDADEETSLLQRETAEDGPDNPATHPSLYKCCFKLYGFTWLIAAVMKLGCDISTLIQPLILRLIIDETGKSSTDRVIWYGVVLALVIFITGQVDAMCYIHSSQMMVSLGLKIKTALIGVIYRKTLKASHSVRKEYTVGEVVNLVSVDCQRVQDALLYSNEIISFFFLIIVGLYELWIVMGVATLGCLFVIIVLIFFNALFGKLQQKYMQEILYFKGKRCKLLNEIICGIKVIKMYTWESYFAEKIKSIREKEMDILRKIARVNAFSILCATHSPFMMNFAILLIYTLMATTTPFDAGTAFLALSVVNILRFPLTLIPFVLTGLIQSVVSIKRIQKFLMTDEVDLKSIQYIPQTEYAISMNNCSFTWEKDTNRPTLGGLNIDIEEGKLIAVVGQVGSGKSSLIASLLGEMEKLEGDVKINGSIAYVSQEAWIQNMTVKDNILFGHAYIDKKYQRVLDGCCLQSDLKILSAGDKTEIGERGINVSGGQKQRISLARAVYSNCDVYLLDDPLSAVDSHVGKDLFRNVIGPDGLLRNKTRILVTHGVHWLPKVDKIIVLHNGRISEQGTYDELVLNDGPFADFLRLYLLQDGDGDHEDSEISKMKDEMWDQIEELTSDGLTSGDEFPVIEGLSRRQSLVQLSRKNSLAKLERRPSAAMLRIPTGSHDSMTANGSNKRLSRRNSSITMYEPIQQHRRNMSVVDTKAPDLNPEGQLVQEELVAEGSVSLSTITEFLKAMGWMAVIVSTITLVANQGLNVFLNFWISFWTEDTYLQNATLIGTNEYDDLKYYYLGMYGFMGVLQGIILISFGILTFTRFVKATGTIHDNGLHSIFRSPMSFFDSTPVGRIMNRFSSDIDVIDARFPMTFRVLSMMGSVLVGTFVVILVTTPISGFALLPLFVLYVITIKLYLPSARQLKRIESTTRSPVFNHFSESITGSSIIRAYKAVDRFTEELYKRVDLNATFYYAANVGMGWVGITIEGLGNLILLAVALIGVLSSSTTGEDIGLALSYSFQIIIAMNIVVRGISEMQMNIVSIERCEEYMHLPSEADWTYIKRPPVDWPERGTIKFVNYKTRYRPGLDLVLRGINCAIGSGERIGIVGRTGAGKSSLTQALFRLIEPVEGSIVIDGIPTTTVGLHDVRSKITILPQDPVLFSDSLRVNLDPLGRFTDQEIWKALEYAHLKEYAMNQNGQLSAELGEGGSNLSVGQRQLVCLARTLLHKTNILILDEATAAVDMETDELIQQTISQQFSNCTILSIAHRLNTVMDYDRIMVMDKGKIVEFDEPEQLLQNKTGVFYSMAADAGLV